MGERDDDWGRGLRQAANAIRAFDQSQEGWAKQFDRETVRAMADMVDLIADSRQQRLSANTLGKATP